MDGLSALSVASSVAQFVEFGYSIASKTKEIYRSEHGASIGQVETGIATRRLIELTRRLKDSIREYRTLDGGSPSDKAIENICDSCIVLSMELLTKLEKLKVSDCQKHRKFKSLRQALKSVWTKDAIDDISRRLESYRRELDDHLLASMCEKFNGLEILHNSMYRVSGAPLQSSIKALLQTMIETSKNLKEGLVLQRECLEDICISQAQLKKDAFSFVAQQLHMDRRADAALLRNLEFSSMRHRREEIAIAHQMTYSWVLGESADEIYISNMNNCRPWSSMVQWLRGDGDIYWINGKAGSGKSTLMRYISEHSKTSQILGEWAEPATLKIVSFYFWNSGTREQRSQSGLLRSMLFDVLGDRPGLIRHIFRSEWDQARSSKQEWCPKSDEFLSFNRLQAAFACLCRHANFASDPFKLCLLVDGLDEYEGDAESMVDLLKSISKSPYVKVCLSSRPWLVFEDAFQQQPRLRLQDLTYKDIQRYVTDVLERHPKMLQLSTSEPAHAAAFVKEIVSKANGVFLWVRLVTKSLLDGLKNRDEIPDLQRRLRLLPSDLDSLYTHILNRIDPFYMVQGCKIFQIYNSAIDIGIRLSILELELAVTATYSTTMTPDRNIMTAEEIQSRCKRMVAYLKIRCGGLLEDHDTLDRHWEATEDYMDENPSPKTSPKPARDALDHVDLRMQAHNKVSYLHRTVKDYMMRADIRARFEVHTRTSPGFDPNMSLLMSYVLRLKHRMNSFVCKWPNTEHLWKTTKDAIHFAQRIDNSLDAHRLVVLQEYFKLAFQWWQHCQTLSNRSNAALILGRWRSGILPLVVRFGLCSYVTKYLEIGPIPRFIPGGSILLYTLGLDAVGMHYESIAVSKHESCPPMLEILLRHGENPNAVAEIGGVHTVWMYTLKAYQIDAWNLGRNGDHYSKWARIFKSMLKYGADITDNVGNISLPNLNYWVFRVTHSSGDNTWTTHSLQALINEIVASSHPAIGMELSDVFQTRRRTKAEDIRKYALMPQLPRKRGAQNFNEIRRPDGKICIDLVDEDDCQARPYVTSARPLVSLDSQPTWFPPSKRQRETSDPRSCYSSRV